MSSLKDKILAAKRPTRTIMVEEWGVEVGVRELSLAERVNLLKVVADAEEAHNAYEADQKLPQEERKGVAQAKRLDHMLLMVMSGIVDPSTHKVVFDVSDYDDFQNLGKMTIERLAELFFEMNTYRSQKTSDELKKTSEPATSDDSASS